MYSEIGVYFDQHSVPGITIKISPFSTGYLTKRGRIGNRVRDRGLGATVGLAVPVVDDLEVEERRMFGVEAVSEAGDPAQVSDAVNYHRTEGQNLA